MNRPGIRLVTLGSALGAVGGIYLYGVLAAAPAPAAAPLLTGVRSSAPPAAAPTKYADCIAPAVLEGQECVTHVEQVVAEPVDVGSADPGGSGGPAAAGSSGSGSARAAASPRATVRAPAHAEAEHDSEHSTERESEHGTERRSDD